jgi:peptidoglycan/LPS O-acetylase OafA/YrhL
VISGFLISGILYRSISTKTFSFSQFWLRRAKRLAPCFVCVSVATSLFAYTILLSTEWNSLSLQILASTFFVSNHWTLHAVGNYWGQQAESIPFLHFWSLSIEEQFYLFFPVMLFVSHRVIVSKQKLLLVFALTCIASIGLAFFINPKYPSYCFYLLPTRAWELLIGVLAFFIHDRWQHQHPQKYWWWSALGLALVIYAFNASRTASGYSLKLAFATCLGTSLCCIFEPNSKSIVGFLLSNRLSTMIGRLSYSLYLWHWPVIVFADFAGFDNSLATLLVIILFSTASYFLIETPFRQMSITTFKKWIPALVAILLLSVLAPRVIPRESTSYSLPQFESTINLAPKYGPGRYREQTGTFHTGLQIRSTSPNRPQIVLLGDSHSLMFFPAVHSAADAVDANLIFFGADGGTTPFLVGNDAPSEHYFDGWSDSERAEFDGCRLRFINSNAPNIAVVCGNWNSYRNKWGDIKFKEKLLELLNACPET